MLAPPQATDENTQQLVNVKNQNVSRNTTTIPTKPSSQLTTSTRTFGTDVSNKQPAAHSNTTNGLLKKRTEAPQLLANVTNSQRNAVHQRTASNKLPTNVAARAVQLSHDAPVALDSEMLNGTGAMWLEDNIADMSLQQSQPHSSADCQMEEDESSQDSESFPLVRMPSELKFTTPATNAQYVDDWIDLIVHNMKADEVNPERSNRWINPQYMTAQTDINIRMREILVDWLIEVHLKFKLQPETLYLTIYFVDRFLAKQVIPRTRLQLVGCTAMLLASKYEEIYAPEVNDFVAISDKAYTREQILQYEQIMLQTLEFNLTQPSALRFSERYTRVAALNIPALQQDAAMKEQFEHLTKYLIELTLQVYTFLQLKPSQVACAAISVALQTVTRKQVSWCSELQVESGYSMADLQASVTELAELARGDASKYRAVRKKYAHRKYGEVSRLAIA